jgi:hypothetical protein
MERNKYSQTSRLEKPEELQLSRSTKHSQFELFSLHNAKRVFETLLDIPALELIPAFIKSLQNWPAAVGTLRMLAGK